VHACVCACEPWHCVSHEHCVSRVGGGVRACMCMCVRVRVRVCMLIRVYMRLGASGFQHLVDLVDERGHLDESGERLTVAWTCARGFALSSDRENALGRVCRVRRAWLW
jgi:hypothetical protein